MHVRLSPVAASSADRLMAYLAGAGPPPLDLLLPPPHQKRSSHPGRLYPKADDVLIAVGSSRGVGSGFQRLLPVPARPHRCYTAAAGGLNSR